MHIRSANPGDIPELMRIEQASTSAAHWTEDRYGTLFNESAPRRLTLVIEDHGITGFLVASTASVEWEIENVVIEEKMRRRGLGRALLLEALNRARKEDAAHMFLEVRESNLPARKLYQSLGFGQIAHRSRYYSHPEEDAILYRFEIK